MDGLSSLSGIRRADAVIVGAGLTGLMTAESLCRSGLRVTVLDAAEPGSGASGLCSGAATLQAAPVYARIAAIHGMDAARLHLEALRETQSALPSLLSGAGHRDADSYVYAFLPRDLPALAEQHKLLTSLGLPVDYAPDAGGCPFPVELSTCLKGQLMADVPSLLSALIRRIRLSGSRIHAHSPVIALESGRVCTPAGRVDAPVVILAAGKPLGDGHPHTLSLLESRTLIQCRLTAQLPLHTLQQSVRPDGLSLRPVPGGAVASWCAARSGTPEEAERTALLTRVLHGRMKDWEMGEFRFQQELWPVDGLPVIGALPGYRGRVLGATGYSGHGLLGAALSAQVLTRHILGRSLPDDALYSPERPLPAAVLTQRQKQLRHLRRAAAWRYRSPRCTLCHCRMRYSIPGERWSCPVCGSAFGMLGQRLNGPALINADISALQRPDL